MRTTSGLLALLLAVSIAGGALHAADKVVSHGQTPRATKPSEPLVTPVAGPSWLNRSHIQSGESSLGRGAGRYGPAAAAPAPTPTEPEAFNAGPKVLTGADLYRLNCQACHRAEGTGAPPEIKSILDLVRGSSLNRLQLEQKGGSDRATALKAQAAAARAELYRRIREGGQRMPPLAHLQNPDIDVLYEYLAHLANVAESKPDARLTVSWARLGENVVKGTCHICHDAVGPRPTDDEMLKGAIPPFTVMVAENSRLAFMSKARTGATVALERPSFHYRGRMPVFYYLRDEELAAAYDFLVSFPPQADEAKHLQ